MDSEPAFSARLANAGLLAGVGLAWAALYVSGSLDDTWLLSGFLAAGLGVPIVDSIERMGRRLSRGSAPPEHERVGQKDDPSHEEDASSDAVEKTPGPRFWVLMVSACLEAVAIGLLAGYYSGSMIVLATAGLVAGVLAIGITLLLARPLSPA